jgi:xanthine dehydrogenase molybdenum-binding subunit
VPCGHMRSPGEPQAAFAVESHMDEVARRVGMDPVEFRLKNLVVDGDAMPNGAMHEELRGRETLRAAADAAGWSTPKRPYIGRGVAMTDRAPGGGVGNLQVTMKQDGSIVLGTPVFDQGTGTYATLQNVVAEVLQIPTESISFDLWATGQVNYDSGIGGMRATRVNTAVAYQAAQDTKAALLKLAADRFEWPEDRLELRGEEIRLVNSEDSVRWVDLLQQTGQDVTGSALVEDRARAEKTCFATQIAEVEVDPETGEVKLLSFTTAHDIAQIINPVMHQGQINGGLVQGIGYAFMEELLVEDGRVTTLSFGDYKIPTSRDIPELKTVLIPTESGLGPYQIKGIGETPNTPTAAAIANAIEDAIGVRIRDLPITSEKVYRALKEAGKA